MSWRHRDDADRAKDIAALQAAQAQEQEAAARWHRVRALADAIANMREQTDTFAARIEEAFRT